MTIESGIQLCEYSAKTNEILMKRYDDASGYTRSGNAEIRTTDAKTCEKRAEEHRQLAAWLRELKERREQVSDDCISRQEAINLFRYNYKGERIPDHDCDNFPVTVDIKTVKDMLRKLSPVIPQPKTGHWIWQTEDIYRCSECGNDIRVKEVMNIPQYVRCPMCEAKMVEPHESEDKE